MGKKRDKSSKAAAPKSSKLGKAEYLEKLAPLQLALNDVARWLQHTGQRLVVVVEGRDTAGKGGVIAAIAETLNPATARSWAWPPSSSAASWRSLAAGCWCR